MVEQPSLIANILIIIGEGFWVVSAAAQLRKLHRTHNPKGLSPITQTLNTAGFTGWATYFALNSLWFPFTTNIMMIFLTVATLAYTLSDRKKFARGLVAIFIIAPITIYMLLNYPGAGGWMGVVYNFIAGLPWLIRVVTRKKVSGISERGLYFSFVAMICVLSYGIIINSWPLIVGGITNFVLSSIILIYYYRYRHHD